MAASDLRTGNPQQQQQQPVDNEPVDEEFTEDFSTMHMGHGPMIPDLFTTYPPVRDPLRTSTSDTQDETVEACLPYLAAAQEGLEYNESGVPRLLRDSHARLLRMSLGKLPGRFVAADASRPWFLYWCLSGLSILGCDVASYRDALVDTARAMQNESGGFGGGGKQLSHLATTYAIVLSLALVGGEEAYEVVDRRAMWRWLCSLKQPDGGFQVCLGGEEDIRGAYCASVIITLLDLPLDLSSESPARLGGHATLLGGLPDYVRRCQTFEGGISAQPGTEAHGAYAFCALGCLAILGHPKHIIPSVLDVPRLLSWLSSRQYAPEGGFSGRTNKLVDGCYSHWVGGCFPLIEACLGGSPAQDAAADDRPQHKLPAASESLYHREGLTRYILCCCQDQSKRGGLRDKPGKQSDQYHSCYVLSGLSSAQHQWECEVSQEASTTGAPDPVWKVLPSFDILQISDDRDRVRPIHPVYAIPQACQENMSDYFKAKGGF